MLGRTSYTIVAVAFIGLFLAPSHLTGQQPSYEETGAQPFGSFSGGTVESVNNENGQLAVHIPLYSAPQRGKLKLSYSLIYRSVGYQLVQDCPSGVPKNLCTTDKRPLNGIWGVTLALDQQVNVSESDVALGATGDNGNSYFGNIYSLHENDGTAHVLAYAGGNSFHSFDGSGWAFVYAGQGPPYYPQSSESTFVATPPGTAIDSDGTQYSSGASGSTLVTDVDGNQMTLTGNSAVDSMNRTIPVSSATTSTANCPTLAAPYQTLTSSTLWTVPGYEGNITYQLCYATMYVSTGNLYSNTYEDYHNSVGVLQSVVLPDGTYWGFVYAAANSSNANSIGYGDLEQIILPTGGSINYTWATGANTCGDEPSTFTGAYDNVLTRTVIANAVSSQWSYSYPTTLTSTPTVTVTDPVGNQIAHTFSDVSNKECYLYETATSYNQKTASGFTALKTVATQYQALAPPNFQNAVAALPSQVTTSYPNGSTSSVAYSYDSGVPFSSYECYYDGGWACQGGATGAVTLGKITNESAYDFSGSLMQKVATQYLWQSQPAYLAANLLNTPSVVTTTGSANQAQTNYTYDESGKVRLSPESEPTAGYGAAPGSVYGHVTTTVRTSNTGSNPSTSTFWLNTGEVDHITDPNGHTTQNAYSSEYDDTYLTAVTNALGQTTSYTYDENTGLVASTTDPNSQRTSFTYDTMGRLTCAAYPDGGEHYYVYNPSGYANNSVLLYKLTSGSQACPDPPNGTSMKTLQVYDQLLRPIQTEILTDPQGTTSSETAYDGVGNTIAVTNRHRTYSSPTDGTTTYSYDALGRPLLQCNQDNGTTGACTAGTSYRQWVYTGPTTDIYDEARNHWQQTVDGIGRLTKVEEPNASNSPTVETDYTWDSLSNLSRVDQWGGASGSTGERVRTFTYDGLSRLITANNPETGTTCYGTMSGGNCQSGYDLNGNLLYRTDARGVVTQYTYDALNRITQKAYPTVPAGIQSTSSVNYIYDIVVGGWGWPVQTSPSYPTTQQTNLVGRLSTVSLNTAGANAWTVYGYDAMGRTALKSECLPIDCGNNHHDIHFRYDLMGRQTFYDRGLNVVENNVNPNQGFYFGGFTSSYDGAGNVSQVEGDTAGTNAATNILSGTDYFPDGQLYTATALGIYNDKFSANSRQWYTGEDVTDPSATTVWQSSASHNYTGTVSATTDKAAGGWSYSYDTLNRLKTAAGPNGHLSYTIDAFGNKYQQTVTSGTGPSLQGYQVATNNALTGNGLTYDAAGNVTYDGYHHYVYDVEGRLYQVDGSVCYIYDGDGDRVARTNCNVSGAGWGHMTGVLSEYLYDTDHRLLSEVNVTSQLMANGNIWAGGRLLAQDAPDANVTTATATQLRITDQVGSLRGLLDLGEHVVQSCTSFPYGDGATCSTPADQLFTGKERDAESGNDYFGARMYGSTLGRFMSPDPLGPWVADATNPQSWNMYSYAMNNPLTNIDPTGYDCVYFNDAGTAVDGPGGIDHNSNSTECGSHGGDWINGTVQLNDVHYFEDSDTFGIRSSDTYNNYLTYANAPGTESNGTSCYGNCDIANGYFPSLNGTPQDVPLNPFAQAVFTQVGLQTAPVVKGMNCAGVGIAAFSPIVTPHDADQARDALFDVGVDASEKGMEAVKETEKLAKGTRVGAGYLGKAAGVAGKVLSAHSAYKDMKEAGCFGKAN